MKSDPQFSPNSLLLCELYEDCMKAITNYNSLRLAQVTIA